MTQLSTTTHQTRAKEHMLVTLWFPEPKTVIDAIREQFPHIEVKYLQVEGTDNFVDTEKLGASVPRDLWEWATILVTLFALPNKVEWAPNLRYIHIFSAGVDHFASHPIFNTPSLAPRLRVSTSTGIAAPPIAEHVVMTLLSLTKRFPYQLSWQNQSHWGTKNRFLGSIGDWVGKTVGIAGYGSIGRHAARILVAMGATVHAYTARPRDTPESKRDRNFHIKGTGDPEGQWPTKWFSGTSKEELHAFLGSGLHALVVSMPLTPSSKGMLGPAEFDVLQNTSPFGPSNFDAEGGKPAGAFVVNIARGPIIDQDALIDAIKKRKIHGAALDVTDPEPLPESSELWGLENVIVTPHTSGLGSEYSGRGFEVVMENLRRQERGEDMLNLIRLG